LVKATKYFSAQQYYNKNLFVVQAWELLAVCLPVIVLGAPLGSVLGSHFHRVVLAMLVVILDTVALVSAFVLLPMSVTMGLVMGAIIVGGIGFFSLLAYAGHRIHPPDVVDEELATMNKNEDDKVKLDCDDDELHAVDHSLPQSVV